jgi:GT2 family glycosyltransferase
LDPDRRLSVVIVTYQSAAWIGACLDSLAAQTYRSFEVVIVDNASTDGTLDAIAASPQAARVERSAHNSGFGSGANRGAAVAGGTMLLFLNPDTKLAPDCLGRIVAAADAAGSEVIVAPEQRSYDGALHLTAGSAVDVLGYPVGDRPGRVFYADGAALLIAKATFERIGGFDGALFLFHEDIDLCWRAALANVPVVRCEGARVYHESGASAEGGAHKGGRYQTTEFRRYHGEKNILRNLLKNYSLANLAWALPLYAVQIFAEIVLMAVLRQTPAVRADLRALRWNMRSLGDTLRARRRYQALRATGDRAIMRNMVRNLYKVMHVMENGIPRVVSGAR